MLVHHLAISVEQQRRAVERAPCFFDDPNMQEHIVLAGCLGQYVECRRRNFNSRVKILGEPLSSWAMSTLTSRSEGLRSEETVPRGSRAPIVASKAYLHG